MGYSRHIGIAFIGGRPMWTITYAVTGSDGKVYKNTKEVKSLSDWDLFNNALHHGAANVVAVRNGPSLKGGVNS